MAITKGQASYNPLPWTFVEVYIIAQVWLCLSVVIFSDRIHALGSNYILHINANT